MKLSPEVILYLLIIAGSLLWRLFFDKKVKIPPQEDTDPWEEDWVDKSSDKKESIRLDSSSNKSLDSEVFSFDKDTIKTQSAKPDSYIWFNEKHSQKQERTELKASDSKPKPSLNSKQIQTPVKRNKRLISLNRRNLKKAVLYKELLTPKYF